MHMCPLIMKGNASFRQLILRIKGSCRNVNVVLMHDAAGAKRRDPRRFHNVGSQGPFMASSNVGKADETC